MSAQTSIGIDTFYIGKFATGTFEMKQLGVQFGEVSLNQLAHLDRLIEKYTTRPEV